MHLKIYIIYCISLIIIALSRTVQTLIRAYPAAFHLGRPPDKSVSYFSPKTYVVGTGTQKNRLNEIGVHSIINIPINHDVV